MPPPRERIGERGEEGAGTAVAFGLALELDPRIDVPGLAAAGSPAASGSAALARTRVWIDPDELERRWRASGAESRRMRELDDGESVLLTVDLREDAGYLLDAADVGRVLVTPDGSEALCDPAPGRADWAFLLSAQVLPLAATLRGHEVFHAAGVAVGGGAVLFAGAPGAGKSSLAAAFLRRGAGLLSDDAVALERGEAAIVAHPGAGALYLREAEHGRLSGSERSALGDAQSFSARQRYAPGAVPEPVPFAALFLLERAEAGLAIEPLAAADPFELLASTFNLSVRTPERLTRQLDMVEALIASGGVNRLRVLPGTDATQLAAAVASHLAEGE